MSRLYLYFKPFGKNEKGIALLFSLIMLSLLLVLALSFALDSMSFQKAAYNSANASSAGFLAQTQLKEILSIIQNNEANLENSELYSHDSGTPTDINKDMLNERLPVSGLLETIDTDKVNWNYIRSKDSAQRIIGRTAFVVIADGIPLGSLLDGRVGTTEYPKHDEELDTETRIGKYVSEINVRAAVPVSAGAAGTLTSGEVDNMTAALNWKGTSTNNTVPGFDAGKYTGRWTDFNKLFVVIETAISSTLIPVEKAEFQNNLSLSAAKTKEAFWAEDTSGDTLINSNELYKRFDLTRNWNTANHTADLAFINGKILLDSGETGKPVQAMEAWADVDSGAASAGLPWLACFGYKDDGTLYTGADLDKIKGTFTGASDAVAVYNRRRQIAANLKDYCDDDGGVHRPTSNVDPATWNDGTVGISSPAPAFTGNEKTPYINKIGFNVRVLRVKSGTNVSATIAITPCVELINIYGQNWSADLKVTLTGNITIQTTINGAAFTAVPYSFDATDITVYKYVDATTPGDWTLSGYSNLCLGTLSAATLTRTSCTNLAVKVEVTAIEITKAVLHNGTSSYDYTKTLTHALPAPPGGTTYPVEVFSSAADPEQSAWFGFAVHDPRQNLNPGDWVHLTPSIADYVYPGDDHPSSTFSLVAGGPTYKGAPNFSGPTPTEAPSVGPDLETGTDPAAQLSTAFIRNAPMESPWELGFIHRGARWQTINLKTYDVDKAFQTANMDGSTEEYIAGGGLYTAGDANILDQIKMTAKAKSPQKINLKSQKIETFNALLSKIQLKPAIDSTMSVASMAGGTTTNMLAEAPSIAANIKTKYPSTASPDKRTRASVVDELLLPTGTGTIPALTDAAQEELIGKIVNLTGIGGKVGTFTIIVLAQTIKDIGGTGGNTIDIHKYSDDGTLGNLPCAISVFDAEINSINDSKANIYYDEITAEQKIIVKGYRTVDGNIEITSFQYVD